MAQADDRCFAAVTAFASGANDLLVCRRLCSDNFSVAAAYDCGSDYRGWTLRCGALFYGQIHLAGGNYYIQLNGRSLESAKSLDEAKDAVERAIIARVRAMLPAYRVVYGRVMHRDGKPPDEPPPVGPPQLRTVRAA